MKYNEYIVKMIEDGWKFSRKIFTEKDLNVKTFSCEKGKSALIVTINCPSDGIMSLCGINTISKYDMSTKAYTIRLKLADENGIEVSSDTEIRITKENSGNNSYIVQMKRMTYDIIKTSYTFEHGIELGKWDHKSECLRIYAIVPDLDIDKDKTKVNIEMDVWSKN